MDYVSYSSQGWVYSLSYRHKQFFFNLDQGENELLLMSFFFVHRVPPTHVHERTVQAAGNSQPECLLPDSTLIFSVVLVALNKYHILWKVAG